MKRIILLLTLSGFVSLISCKGDFARKKNDLESFKDIKIVYITGDEVIRSYGMLIYDSVGLVKARFTSPISDNNNFVRILNQANMQMVYDFIDRAKKQNDTCFLLSTSLDRYRIKIGIKDSISIFGNCKWDGLDYAALTQKILDE